MLSAASSAADPVAVDSVAPLTDAAPIVAAAAALEPPAAAAFSASPFLLSLDSLLASVPLPSSAPALPPFAFSLVAEGLYRSACPAPRSLDFLESIGIKSIVFLAAATYPDALQPDITNRGIRVECFELAGNREPFVSSNNDTLARALLFALDNRNGPVLVHCLKGTHRTGCFVGVLRRLAGWSLSAIFAEYRTFQGPASAARDLDRLMIECFDIDAFKQQLRKTVPEEHRPDWIV